MCRAAAASVGLRQGSEEPQKWTKSTVNSRVETARLNPGLIEDLTERPHTASTYDAAIVDTSAQPSLYLLCMVQNYIMGKCASLHYCIYLLVLITGIRKYFRVWIL